MLLDYLHAYHDELLGKYSPATAKTYCKRLLFLLEGQPIVDTPERLDLAKAVQKLGEIRYSNYFSQAKNAFLHFCTFQRIELSIGDLATIKEMGRTAKKKHRKLKPVKYSQVYSKIMHIRNPKLKICYQVMLATGLRVSELASLSTSNCSISDESITFDFIGKGNKAGTAEIRRQDHPHLYERLKNHIEAFSLLPTSHNKKLFYSVGYLQSKAKQLGFTCLDLRRAFAKLTYKACRNKSEVRHKLRHSKLRTTNIYLRSKVKV